VFHSIPNNRLIVAVRRGAPRRAASRRANHGSDVNNIAEAIPLVVRFYRFDLIFCSLTRLICLIALRYAGRAEREATERERERERERD